MFHYSIHINAQCVTSSQAPVDNAELVDGSVISYIFTYHDGSGSPPSFVVPNAHCVGGICEHVFNPSNGSLPPFYTVSVTATNVIGEGPVTTSPPICKKMDTVLI